jgi:hypothetical protein
MSKRPILQLIRGLPRGITYKVSRRVFLWKSREDQFAQIFRSGGFGNSVSLSGSGSDLTQTSIINIALPELLKRLNVKSILDSPCGDLYWMQHVKLGQTEYIGGDIVKDLVSQNQQRFGKTKRFVEVDLCKSDLPSVDLVFCRDCLVHLKLRDAISAIKNIKRSGSNYLLTTTYPHLSRNEELGSDFWRPLNLEKSPFLLPAPMELVIEGCTEPGSASADKSLGLWRLSDITL